MSTPIKRIDARATRLPPFGREVENAITENKSLNVYLFAGRDAWECARARREAHGSGSALLLPPGDDPTAYRWPTVANGVLIVAPSEPRARAFALAQAVVSCGTPMAFAAFGDHEALIVRASDWRALEHAA